MRKSNIFLKGNTNFLLESTKTKSIDLIANNFFKKSSKWKIIKNRSQVKQWIIKFKKSETNKTY